MSHKPQHVGIPHFLIVKFLTREWERKCPSTCYFFNKVQAILRDTKCPADGKNVEIKPKSSCFHLLKT